MDKRWAWAGGIAFGAGLMYLADPVKGKRILVEWDAVTTEVVPNEQLAWKSAPGSVIRHAGVVRFDTTPEGGTSMDIRMSYKPPAGALGHAVAALFGADPKQALDEDLVRFKSLIETGKTTARDEQVTREEVQPQASSKAYESQPRRPGHPGRPRQRKESEASF